MADLWIYGRKPAASVRYQHGGLNATFPMNGHTVLEQIGLTVERDAAQAAREAAERERPRKEGFEAANVLHFSSRAARGSRGSQPGRTNSRSPGKRPPNSPRGGHRD